MYIVHTETHGHIFGLMVLDKDSITNNNSVQPNSAVQLQQQQRPLSARPHHRKQSLQQPLLVISESSAG